MNGKNQLTVKFVLFEERENYSYDTLEYSAACELLAKTKEKER